jgi:hypothetical protein
MFSFLPQDTAGSLLPSVALRAGANLLLVGVFAGLPREGGGRLMF